MFIFLYQHITDTISSIGQMELEIRNELFPRWIVFVAFGSILLLAIVKNIYPSIFKVTLKSVFRSNIQGQNSEGLSYMWKAVWLMIFNYFLISSTLIYMILCVYDLQDYYLLSLSPIVYYFFIHFTLFLSGIISGESNRLIENHHLVILNHKLLSLLLLPILIVWTLDVNNSMLFIKIIIVIFLLLFIFRIIKGFGLAFKNNVPWYYIILYFCTLEIWPFVVLYKLT